ncbi:MAG: PAS domain S-box protein [Methanomicrobiaceae archaeon]|nr:PAS domain S-box protein [Methanomicrobiaceae archaeon]
MEFAISQKWSGITTKLIVTLSLTLIVVALTIISLINNIQVVFTQFYYIPIILTAYWFNKKGVLYTIFLSAFYITAVYVFSPQDEQVLLAASGRIVFFIGISLASAYLAIKINRQKEQITRSEERHRAIWDSIQAGIILIDAKNHTIIAANPEVQKMTGFSESEMVGHICHKFICPAEEGKCPIGDLGLKVDRSERILLSREGVRIPVLKTVTEMRVGNNEFYVESFIDITSLKDAENTLLAYLREATLRVQNPVELVRDNLQELSDALKDEDTTPEYISTALAIQQRNMDDIISNLKEIEHAVAEKRTEIPDALREYLKR